MPPSRIRTWSLNTPPAMSSPTAATAKASPGGSRIGRPPQWTISRSRKLARLYVYTTLSIEKIIKVLEDDVFKPRKNSAQKTIHKMLDNDPRYLRPDSRLEMNQRINNLSTSPARNRGNQQHTQASTQYHATSSRHSYPEEEVDPLTLARDSTSSSSRSIPSYNFGLLSPSSGITEGLRRLSIPMRPGEEMETAIPGPGDDNYLGVRDIQRRVSDCSTLYASQLSSLLRKFSIASTSDPEDEEQQLEHGPGPSRLIGTTFRAGSVEEPLEQTPKPQYALPGDFLKAHQWKCADVTSLEHATGRCWCSIASETSNTLDSWFLPTGQSSERAKLILADPAQANIFPRDHFGNTPLHLIASLMGYREVLFGMVLHGINTRATNKGRQTFLHVLNEEWFSDVSSPSAPLNQLLALLHESVPDLIYETDVYGRTFFHRAHALVADPEALVGLLSPFNRVGASHRDAFGFSPLANIRAGSEAPSTTPQRLESLSPREDDVQVGSPAAVATRSRHAEGRPSSADEVSFLAYHARLVQVIQSSYNDAHVEDDDGRNGLQCLAEAIIHQQTMDEQRSVMSTGRSLKRKLEAKDTPSPVPARSSTAVSTMTGGSRTNAEGTLLTRLRHLEGLTIHSTHPVDINHYDKHGNTVLMAFITHISDDQDDKSKTLVSILETLIHAGARLESRNRRGETALLVAARLGRKAALTTLLENGANVYARDVDGRGVLEVVDETCRGARGDVALYARLEACRVLLTGRRDWGVILKPSVVMEWGAR